MNEVLKNWKKSTEIEIIKFKQKMGLRSSLEHMVDLS